MRGHALSIRAFIFIGNTDTGSKIVANSLGNKINIEVQYGLCRWQALKRRSETKQRQLLILA